MPTGTRPTGVVTFKGQYVVVGTVWLETFHQPGHITPSYDPSRNRGVVWTSHDGRAWTLHDGIAAFEQSTVTGLATDGTRLVAYGYYAPQSGADSVRVGATWASTDGVHWARATSPAPSIVAGGPSGFVGAFTTEDWEGTISQVRFATSSDGLTWTSRTSTFAAGLGDPGAALALAMACPEHVLAMNDAGAIFAGGTGGTSGTDAELWYSATGKTWNNAGLIPTGSVDAIVASGDHFIAATHGVSPDTGEGIRQLWELHLFAEPAEIMGSPLSVNDSYLNPPGLFASGGDVLLSTLDGSGQLAAWLSTDGGSRFAPMANPFDISGLLDVPGGLLLVGDETVSGGGDSVPKAWLGLIAS